MMRSGRDAAGENSSRRNRLRYSRLRADLRSITNLDMIDNTHLACQRHIFAYSCATGNPCLSRDDGIFPNHHVVGNLHEIVNLCTTTDNRAPQCRPVHRCVCADFNVVFNFHRSDLRNLDPILALPA